MSDRIPVPGWLCATVDDIPIPPWLRDQVELPGWLRNPHPAPSMSARERARREAMGMAAMDAANRVRAAQLGLSASLTPSQEILRRRAEEIYSAPQYVSGRWRGPVMGVFVPSAIRAQLTHHIY